MKFLGVSMFAALFAAMGAVTLATEDDGGRGVPVRLEIRVENLSENIEPNDPTLPRSVSFQVEWYRADASGNHSTGPGGVTSWVIDLGDGTQVVDDDVTSPRFTNVTHTYTTKGLKHITVTPVYDAGGLEFLNPGATTYAGPLTNYDPGFNITPTQGVTPLDITVSVNSFPPDAISQELKVTVVRNSALYSPVYMNPTVSTSAVCSIPENKPGLYVFYWDGPSRICRGTSDVYLFPATVRSSEIQGDFSNRPQLTATTPLNGINTPGTEWNARTTDDGSSLFYLSTWDGQATIMRAPQTSPGSGDYSNPAAFFAPPQGFTIRGFEISSDASVILLNAETDFFGPQLAMIQGVGQEAMRIIELSGAEDWRKIAGDTSLMGTDKGLGSFSLDASGLRVIVPDNYIDIYGPEFLTAYDRDPQNQYRFLRQSSVIEIDQHRRLMSADQRVRVWHGQARRAANELDPVRASVVGTPNVSLYNQFTDAEARFEWYTIQGNPPSITRLEQLSADGTKLYITSNRAGGAGALDIFRADLIIPPSRAQQQAVIVDHVTASEESADPAELDLNIDSLVDSGDVETVP